jgi:hypothetical protein
VNALRPPQILFAALRDSDRLGPGYRDWEWLIRQARAADLLGTLAVRLEARGRLGQVPDAPRAHLTAALYQCRAQEVAVHREVDAVRAILRPLRIPVVLLKGAAYVLAGLPPARGRMFSDIDILVPRDALPAVESALMLGGFATTHPHPYDQRYYRRWRHELPPMQHVKRLTILDVHHTIVADISGVHVDTGALFRAAVPLAAVPDLCVLAPVDMLLHSATHLFRNEDLTHGYRDLVDLDALLRHFGDEPGFWQALPGRASQLGLGRPLYYALHWTQRMFGTVVPAAVASAVAVHAPPPATRWLMEQLFERALRPEARHAPTLWARRALYVRGHWLKMPVPLLAWHLTVKAFRRDEQSA